MSLLPAALSRDHAHWVRPRNDRFFLPVGVLSEVFRGKVSSKRSSRLTLPDNSSSPRPASRPGSAQAAPEFLIRQLYAPRWVVYCKPPFGGPIWSRYFRYLGVYTHRVAISNHRLVSFVEDQVTFSGWRDSAHKNKK